MTEELRGKVDIDNDAYHAGPGVSKSHFDSISPMNKGCPLKYWYKHVREDREPSAPTPNMIAGTAMHTLVLEPDDFDVLYVKEPKIDRRTKAGKEEAAAFEQEHQGKILLTTDQIEKVKGMAGAINRHATAAPLLRAGEAEASYYAIDEGTGLLIKSRPDFVTDDGNIMVDLKSTVDASPEGFARSIVNFRYFMQPAWYGDVMRAAGYTAPKHFVFIAVEKEPPYAVGVYYATPEIFDIGREQSRYDLDLIAQCHKAGEWPDYAVKAKPIELPAWFARRASQ